MLLHSDVAIHTPQTWTSDHMWWKLVSIALCLASGIFWFIRPTSPHCIQTSETGKQLSKCAHLKNHLNMEVFNCTKNQRTFQSSCYKLQMKMLLYLVKYYMFLFGCKISWNSQDSILRLWREIAKEWSTVPSRLHKALLPWLTHLRYSKGSESQYGIFWIY